MKPWLKVSCEILGKPGIELATSYLQMNAMVHRENAELMYKQGLNKDQPKYFCSFISNILPENVPTFLLNNNISDYNKYKHIQITRMLRLSTLRGKKNFYIIY